jgi:hypothetical protein
MEMMIGLLGGGFAPVAIVLSFLAEVVRSRMPPPSRVITDPLPWISTQISVSGYVLFHTMTPSP